MLRAPTEVSGQAACGCLLRQTRPVFTARIADLCVFFLGLDWKGRDCAQRSGLVDITQHFRLLFCRLLFRDGVIHDDFLRQLGNRRRRRSGRSGVRKLARVSNGGCCLLYVSGNIAPDAQQPA